jgi:hypothetical protein
MRHELKRGFERKMHIVCKCVPGVQSVLGKIDSLNYFKLFGTQKAFCVFLEAFETFVNII